MNLIDQPKGSWIFNNTNPIYSFIQNNKAKIIIISFIALAAIASLATGGSLLHLHVNATIVYILMGSGAGLGMGASVSLLIACIKHKKAIKQTKIVMGKQYHIVTWNVGSKQDYSNMCFLDKNVNKSTLAKAFSDVQTTEYQATEEELEIRKALFKEAFTQFNSPDIICLQETSEMDEIYLTEILPQGYEHCSITNADGAECTIAYKGDSFALTAYGNVRYDSTYVTSQNTAPDTMLILKDLDDGTTLCVASSHLRGFSLQRAQSSNQEIKNLELTRAEAGNNQAKYNLATMADVSADLYIYAGDFNVTQKHYNQRLEIIENQGFVTDKQHQEPTILDGNLTNKHNEPLPTKLDYVYAKSISGSISIEGYNPSNQTLNNFKKPSDHLPVGAKITFSNI